MQTNTISKKIHHFPGNEKLELAGDMTSPPNNTNGTSQSSSPNNTITYLYHLPKNKLRNEASESTLFFKIPVSPTNPEPVFIRKPVHNAAIHSSWTNKKTKEEKKINSTNKCYYATLITELIHNSIKILN
jgi:hypothetical protein